MRQSRGRACAGQRDDPGRSRLGVERRKTADEITRVGEIEVMHPGGDRRARQPAVGALERPGGIDDRERAGRAQNLGGDAARVQRDRTGPVGVERSGQGLGAIEVPRRDDHIKLGCRQQPFNEPPAKAAGPANDQDWPRHCPGAARSPVRKRPAISGRGAMHVSVRPNHR